MNPCVPRNTLYARSTRGGSAIGGGTGSSIALASFALAAIAFASLAAGAAPARVAVACSTPDDGSLSIVDGVFAAIVGAAAAGLARRTVLRIRLGSGAGGGAASGTGGGGISVSVAVNTAPSGSITSSTGQNVQATCRTTDAASATSSALRTRRGRWRPVVDSTPGGD